MKKLNKYKQNPELIVDLHGYTTFESQTILDEILTKGEYKYIRVIVGRGLNSEHGPILPDFVKNYFIEHNDLLGQKRRIRFSPSKPADGGEGALEVFL